MTSGLQPKLCPSRRKSFTNKFPWPQWPSLHPNTPTHPARHPLPTLGMFQDQIVKPILLLYRKQSLARVSQSKCLCRPICLFFIAVVVMVVEVVGSPRGFCAKWCNQMGGLRSGRGKSEAALPSQVVCLVCPITAESGRVKTYWKFSFITVWWGRSLLWQPGRVMTEQSRGRRLLPKRKQNQTVLRSKHWNGHFGNKQSCNRVAHVPCWKHFSAQQQLTDSHTEPHTHRLISNILFFFRKIPMLQVLLTKLSLPSLNCSEESHISLFGSSHSS